MLTRPPTRLPKPPVRTKKKSTGLRPKRSAGRPPIKAPINKPIKYIVPENAT